jgi:hypothetical protein
MIVPTLCQKFFINWVGSGYLSLATKYRINNQAGKSANPKLEIIMIIKMPLYSPNWPGASSSRIRYCPSAPIIPFHQSSEKPYLS